MADAAPDKGRSGQGRGGGLDLGKMTVPKLTTLIENAEAVRREKQEEAKSGLLAEFREKAAGLGLSLNDLLPRPQPTQAHTRKTGGAKVPVKYRGPNGEEWSGRGRQPHWVVTVEKHGQKRTDFLVSKETTNA